MTPLRPPPETGEGVAHAAGRERPGKDGYTMQDTARVTQAMIGYFEGDARRVNHFLKVYALAKTIGELEGLPAETQYTLEVAALTHDIGIKPCECKHGPGSATGVRQEEEGPGEAHALLGGLGIATYVTQRVCWLIAHHHSYGDIRDTDLQILVEADFLVNLYEDGMGAAAAQAAESRVFRTQAGKALLRGLYPALFLGANG